VGEREQEVSIRRMTISDAAVAAELSGELGYPVTRECMEERLRRFATLPDHVVLAACLREQVVGWVDVSVTQHLQTAMYGEIGGLVVSEKCRSHGVGQKLLEAAEQWIAARGIGTVAVRSRSTRERAHAFYLRHGYAQVKTSVVFRKELKP
jgi:GNAT superfamily N-acetyltransferase